MKPPDWNKPPLEEPGGVPLGLIHTAEKAGVEATKHAVINMCEPGRVSLDAHTALAPTEGIASVKPASGAVEATTARPEALEPRAKSVEWSELQLLLLPYKDSGKSRTPPQEPPKEGICRHGLKAPLLPP